MERDRAGWRDKEGKLSADTWVQSVQDTIIGYRGTVCAGKKEGYSVIDDS